MDQGKDEIPAVSCSWKIQGWNGNDVGRYRVQPRPVDALSLAADMKSYIRRMKHPGEIEMEVLMK